jgi:GNAT superfamily N-acetyltransferase
MYHIRRTTDLEAVKRLHSRLFPKTQLDGDAHWLVWEDKSPEPVGFASARESTVKGWLFLARAGVLPAHRGFGLQGRLIAVREKWARANGYKFSLTYVANWNSGSLINLLKAGYTVYDPGVKKRKKLQLDPRDGYTYLHKKL